MYGKFYGQEHVPYPDDPEVLKSPEEKQADQLKQLKNDLLITLSTTIIYGLLILMFFQNGMLILGTSVYGAEIFLLFYVACPIFSVIAIVYFLFIGRRHINLELSTENIIALIIYEVVLVVGRQLMLAFKPAAHIIFIPYLAIAVFGVVYVYLSTKLEIKVKRWFGWLIGYFVVVDLIVAGCARFA